MFVMSDLLASTKEQSIVVAGGQLKYSLRSSYGTFMYSSSEARKLLSIVLEADWCMQTLNLPLERKQQSIKILRRDPPQEYVSINELLITETYTDSEAQS